MGDEDTVTITKKEYDHLQKAADILSALENAGVDNWDGFGPAMASIEEGEEE